MAAPRIGGPTRGGFERSIAKIGPAVIKAATNPFPIRAKVANWRVFNDRDRVRHGLAGAISGTQDPNRPGRLHRGDRLVRDPHHLAFRLVRRRAGDTGSGLAGLPPLPPRTPMAA